MLRYMRTRAAEWSERVRAWRESGQSAEEFAKAGAGYRPTTLRWWASDPPRRHTAPCRRGARPRQAPSGRSSARRNPGGGASCRGSCPCSWAGACETFRTSPAVATMGSELPTPGPTLLPSPRSSTATSRTANYPARSDSRDLKRSPPELGRRARFQQRTDTGSSAWRDWRVRGTG